MVYIWLSTGYLVVLEIEELELDGAELFVYRLPGGPRLNDSNLMVYIWLSEGYLVVLEIEELELDGAELFVYGLPYGPRG